MRGLRLWLAMLAMSLPLAAVASPKKTGSLAAVVAVPLGAKNASDLRSFREWKAEKVKAATEKVDHVQAQIQTHKGAGLRDLEQQLSQEQWNLEVAQDLSITDYLVLYLASKGSAAQLTEAARKLSPEETAQILEAYLRSLGSSSTAATLPPAASLIGR